MRVSSCVYLATFRSVGRRKGVLVFPQTLIYEGEQGANPVSMRAAAVLLVNRDLG